MAEPAGMAPPTETPGFLEAEVWENIQQQVPIVCVDVVVMSNGATRYGLISRETADEGRKLCLTGGRIYRNETVAEAISRQLLTTLGGAISFELDDEPQPLYVAQYFPDLRDGHGWDSRKHAVALTFVVDIAGPVEPMGEACDFIWFPIDHRPERDEMGFAQHFALNRCLQALARRRGS
jgi:ADP-ribose pyrophosphatase YjhB (NUDIX family)